jgi:gliding motility-associated-like protein
MVYLLRITVAYFLIFVSFTSDAQVSHIGGIINSYAAVQSLNYCENKVTVNSMAGFQPNQKVLMIQMKGAQISTGNNLLFGTINDYKGCGNFEVNTIEWIAGNDIKLKYAIVRDYEDGGSIQLVSIPEYTTATTDSALRAKEWDGASGGVFILKADTLILNDSISVFGAGFRGAQLENETTCWNSGNGGANDYVYATSVAGARKGEGIGNTPFPFGRGKNANGGGGGNDHNTGGGGGSNYGAGGRGGTRSNVSQFSCPGPSPGDGGLALDYNNTANKIFMGGGGGAGDENNNEGTAGANGGGICIIMAKFLLSNDQKINANGKSVTIKAQSDGAGGGGGGGTVLLYVDDYLGNLLVNANGGNGGKLDNGGSNTFCFGPGAGGGGGLVWVKGNSLPGFVNVIDTGGINGWNVFGISPPACPLGTTNGAQPGEDGGTLNNLQITEANVPFVQVTAQACCDTIVCPAASIQLNSSGTSTYPPPVFNWSNGNTNPDFVTDVYSTQQYVVTVTDHRQCTATAAINVTVPEANVSITANPDSAVILGQSVQLTALSSTALTYVWSPASGLSDANIYNPIATPDVTTNYCVTVTNAYGCTGSACKTIELLLPDVKVPDAFSPNADGVNDVFTIFEGNYADIQDIKIYNRWGEVVFTSPVNAAWDGTHKGNLQNAGSYVCRVVYSSPLNPGKTKEVVKDIVLIR